MTALMFHIAVEQREYLENVRVLQVGRTWYFSHSHHQPAASASTLAQNSITNFPLHRLLNIEKAVILEVRQKTSGIRGNAKWWAAASDVEYTNSSNNY